MASPFVGKVNFGPFLFEPKTGRLTKHGQKIKLQPKSAAVLRSLLEHEGEVVTREQLRNVLWPEGTFVDFDLGIKVAVKKLRDALSDSADDPIYVQTAQGGYCFISRVEHVGAVPIAVTSGPRSEVDRPYSSSQADDVRQPPASRAIDRSWRQRRPATWAVTALACIILVAIGAASLGWRRVREPDHLHTGKIMLVVLPFENLSGDPKLEYLADGITEELSEQLGNLNSQRLGVIGRTSAMTYKHSTQTIKEIGRELGVGYVLEGSVRQEGEKLRITAQLVRVSDQAHVWAADYDRNMRGLMQLEDDVARQITSNVGVSVAVVAHNLNQHTPDPEAHRAYLLARYYWNKRTSVGEDKARQYFRRAIQLDPQYAAAYAGLAECTAIPEAKAAALKAVELDPSSGEARTALGFVQLFREVDVPAAERTLKAAVELDPNYATAHHWYAGVLEASGRLPEATAELRKATTLDPLSLIIRSALAHVLSLSGQQDAALAELRPVFEMDPHFSKAHEALAGIYERKGLYKEAIHEFQLSVEAGEKEGELGAIGYIYAISGNKQAALEVLTHLQELNKRSEAFALDIALVDIALGRKVEAIAWMEKASLKPDDGWLCLRTDPRFDPLRSDPRFQALLRHMSLIS